MGMAVNSARTIRLLHEALFGGDDAMLNSVPGTFVILR